MSAVTQSPLAHSKDRPFVWCNCWCFPICGVPVLMEATGKDDLLLGIIFVSAVIAGLLSLPF